MPENLSTALMIFGISMIIMFIGRVPFKFLLAYVGMGVVGVILFALVLTMVSKETGYRYGKTGSNIIFPAKLMKDGDYQSNQAKIAISTGGLIRQSSGQKHTEKYASPIKF